MTASLGTRSLTVQVDTTEPAEVDLAALGLGDADVHEIAHELSASPFRPGDAVAGLVRTRRVGGLDVSFLVSRDDTDLVLTVLRVSPAEDGAPDLGLPGRGKAQRGGA